MYRVVIVDDEINICEGMKSFIDWEKEGFTVVGTATSGREGCQLIEKLNVDLVLTDIRMPQMNGHDLISYVRENFPKIVIIVLSGYSSFDYAKEAMNRGACCYLLKPIQEGELRQWLGRIKESLDKSSQHRRELHQLRAQVATDRTAILKHILQDIILGKNSWDQLQPEIRSELCNAFGLERFGVLVCDAPGDGHAGQPTKELQKLAEKYAEERIAFAFPCGQERTAMFLVSASQTLLESQLEDWATSIWNELSMTYPVTIGLSRLCDDPSLLQDAFAQAEQALQGKIILGGGRCNSYRDMQEGTVGKTLKTETQERELMEAVRVGDIPRTTAVIEKIFETIIHSGCVMPDAIYNHCIHLAFAMKQSAISGGAAFEDAAVDSCALLAELKQQNTLREIARVIQFQGKNLAEKVRMSRLQQSIVGRICSYIQLHYHEEITLETLAREFFLNQSYISFMIKKELGQNFTDYLSQIRINEAKRLILDSKLKIYEVGEKVGYHNPRYFAQIFERITGQSPSEYRKKVQEGQGAIG